MEISWSPLSKITRQIENHFYTVHIHSLSLIYFVKKAKSLNRNKWGLVIEWKWVKIWNRVSVIWWAMENILSRSRFISRVWSLLSIIRRWIHWKYSVLSFLNIPSKYHWARVTVEIYTRTIKWMKAFMSQIYSKKESLMIRLERNTNLWKTLFW